MVMMIKKGHRHIQSEKRANKNQRMDPRRCSTDLKGGFPGLEHSYRRKGSVRISSSMPALFFLPYDWVGSTEASSEA